MFIKFGRRVSQVGVYLFALIGLILVGGWLGLRFGLTKTAGQVDFNDRYFKNVAEQIRQVDLSAPSAKTIFNNNCQLLVINRFNPTLGRSLLEVYNNSRSEKVLAKALLAADIFLRSNQDYQNGLKACHDFYGRLGESFSTGFDTSYNWLSTPEWQVLREAIAKDKDQINQAAQLAGISPRLIVGVLVGEQLRLYNSEREVYKQVFQPLKILGVQSQFSWGVTGLKEETAKQIETNLRDANSVFYLGGDKANLLDFKTADISTERFERLIDSHNHYYSYLYTAIYLKQLIVEWQKAGYNIENRPEILATLFNLGFTKSVPKANPQVGGAEIEIVGQKYSFGSLAYQFYYSGELSEEFNWQ
jgi:hypothetical protein